jgi:hypothetical protein
MPGRQYLISLSVAAGLAPFERTLRGLLSFNALSPKYGRLRPAAAPD